LSTVSIMSGIQAYSLLCLASRQPWFTPTTASRSWPPITPYGYASELLGTLRVAQQRLGQDQTCNGRSGEGGIVGAIASLDANPCRFL
jgi:hypothetical protein